MYQKIFLPRSKFRKIIGQQRKMRLAFLIATVVAGPVYPGWVWDSGPKVWNLLETYCTSPEGSRTAYWWEQAEEILVKYLKNITSITDVSKSS